MYIYIYVSCPFSSEPVYTYIYTFHTRLVQRLSRSSVRAPELSCVGGCLFVWVGGCVGVRVCWCVGGGAAGANTRF